MKKYEIYEDNGGGLYLCLFDNEDNCIKIFDNWEYDVPGILVEAIGCIDGYFAWDNDMVKRLSEEGIETTAQIEYDKGLGVLIADNNGIYGDDMGNAGKRAFNLFF